jgi:hypothetical protein
MGKCKYIYIFFFSFGLWGYWHCGHSWPIFPASGDSENDCGEADGMWIGRENRSSRRKPAQAPLLSIKKSHMTRPGFESRPRGGKPATNRLSYGADQWRYSSNFLNFGTRQRWMVSFRVRPLYPRRINPRYQLYRRLSAPELVWTSWKEKYFTVAGNWTPAIQLESRAIPTGYLDSLKMLDVRKIKQ